MRITEYHSVERFPIQRGKTVSLELECRVPYKNIKKFAEEIFSKIKNIILERDSSLDFFEGVEVVFSNKEYELLKEEINIFSEIAKKYNATAHKAGRGYGIHISISKMGWELDDVKCAKIVMLIDNFKEFFELVGQRESAYCYKYGNKTNDLIENQEKVLSRAKYKAISFRDNDRIEFRLFRSNIREEKIFKCIETVISLVEYFKSLQKEERPKIEKYIEFIFKNIKDYENLCNFILSKKEIVYFLTQFENLKKFITKETIEKILDPYDKTLEMENNI